ncbi:hypothetical protein FGIG_11464 [Fasciola gigantica]|uniref:Uncharacterized protein n=1 Tax=Fasciola gigantica TaxID=46835 RepID=A0A504YRH7_FASGI|nr:hypothetical protein FGIG_11464 [Fasciola gigantica]
MALLSTEDTVIARCYERIIRSVRRNSAFQLLADQFVVDEALVTMCGEVEEYLIDRPLTRNRMIPVISTPITPNHFFLLRVSSDISFRAIKQPVEPKMATSATISADSSCSSPTYRQDQSE